MRKGLLQGILLLIFAVFLLITCKTSDPLIKGELRHEVSFHDKQLCQSFGITNQNYTIKQGVITPNLMLSSILHKQGISAKNIETISQSKTIFDVRKIRAGNNYYLFHSKDSVTKLQYLVYEHSVKEFVTIDFTDSVNVSFNTKATKQVNKMISGTIETNLWDAMVKNDIDPMMSIEISEIYAWSIDFFDLKKGDQFHVIYEDEVLNDTQSIGVKRIYAALFNHQNKAYYAIHFTQNNDAQFYDESGQNLRNQFLKTPLKYSRISSTFTKSRYHPVLKIYRPHSGIDYAAPIGTPVYSVGDGVVLKQGHHKKGAGRFIKIKHDDVYTTQYAHLQKFAQGLAPGDKVKQGQLIGYVGNSGYSTGPHLDFRFFENGVAIDPLLVHGEPNEPIQEINKAEFERLRDVYINQFHGQQHHFLVAWKDYIVEHEEF